ncbi:MAG: PDZ domain-containing protein [Planctomycetota bacterium]|nr:PDZ domain-containing protein [Planctomycetota bacterium]
MLQRIFTALLISLAILCIAAPSYNPAVAEEGQASITEKEYWTRCLCRPVISMRAKKHDQALEVLLEILSYRPDDASCWYNAACCAAIIGEKRDALNYLENAFESGYVDFGWAEKDPDLDSIRKTMKYRRLMAKKRQYYEKANAKRLLSVKQYYSKHYKVKLYEEDRVIFVSDAPEKQYIRLLDIIRRVNANHRKLFRNEPNIYNIVLCPSSKEEYNKHYPPMNVLGVFMPRTKTLFVDMNVGEGTLVHEYTHALHFADQEGLGQQHPIWIVEGFATLFENSSFSGRSKLIPRHGFRLMHLYKMLESNAFIPLKKVMNYDHRRFMARAGACYAESRLLMYYLYRQNKLYEFYYKYINDYETDPTGIHTLRNILNKPMEEIEEEYKAFVNYIGKGIYDTKVSLGVKLTMAALNCLVFEVDEGSPADEVGIKPGDILYSYNGRRLRSSSDLTQELSREKPGDTARIVIERDGKKIKFEVTYPEEEMIPGSGYMGVKLTPNKGSEGLVVAYVAKDSPADQYGLQTGDIIIEIDSQKLDSPDDFKSVMATKVPGNYLRLLIIRDKKMLRKRIRLSKKPTVSGGINPGV